jgi:hypothetical protein
LYFARSLDGGKTWSNATGTVSLSTLQFNQPGFAVVGGSHDVGLFKALAVTGAYPGTPWIAYQPGADLGSGTLVVAHRSGGRWARHSLDSSRNWNNHLVMRSPASGQIYLWSDIAQSGTKSTDLAEWVRSTTGQWSKRFLSVGPNWFLTGTSAGGTHEVLMWRGAAGPTGSRDVAFRLVGIT